MKKQSRRPLSGRPKIVSTSNLLSLCPMSKKSLTLVVLIEPKKISLGDPHFEAISLSEPASHQNCIFSVLWLVQDKAHTTRSTQID